MKKNVVVTVIALLQSLLMLNAQVPNGPYVIRNSEIFKSPKGHKVLDPLGFGKDGIIQVNSRGVESFSFQKFSKDLKFEKENTVNTESIIGDHAYYERIVSFKNKTYLFTRHVDKDKSVEGVAALEFLPKKMDFASKKETPLFMSSTKVRTIMLPGASPYFFGFGGSTLAYGFEMSQDSTKFMYNYELVSKEKKDKINKDVIGMHIYDENLKKLWGGEFQMPYTEAVMDNEGYTVANDGKIYLLAKVKDLENKKAKKKAGELNYHYEILVYEKDVKKPKIIELKLDNYFPTEAYIYEDGKKNIVVAGYYSKDIEKLYISDGFYIVKLDVEKSVVSKVNGGYYEIPSDVIKQYLSDRALKQVAKKEKKGDIGLGFLRIRNVFTAPSGAIKIISEQYHQYTTTTTDSKGRTQTRYHTDATDLFVMSIDNNGKMEWVKKIKKDQYASNWTAASLSINVLAKGDDLNIFFMENLKNEKVPPAKAKRFIDGAVGVLRGVTIDSKGKVTTYKVGETKQYKTRFSIRYFVDGGNKNLLRTERRKKKNMLFSIEPK